MEPHTAFRDRVWPVRSSFRTAQAVKIMQIRVLFINFQNKEMCLKKLPYDYDNKFKSSCLVILGNA